MCANIKFFYVCSLYAHNLLLCEHLSFVECASNRQCIHPFCWVFSPVYGSYLVGYVHVYVVHPTMNVPFAACSGRVNV